MQVSVETTNGLKRKATITVPSEDLEERINERLQSAAGNLKLPGFRPGKVPLKEVRRRFGAALREEAASELCQSSFANAVARKKLSLASQATIEIVNMAAGRDLEYTATFEVMPEIELVDFATLKIRSPMVQIEEADVDATVESLRKQRAEWHRVERPAANQDRLHMDFATKAAGEIKDRRDDMELVLGEYDGRHGGGKELHDALVGVVAGETRVFPITPPPLSAGERQAGAQPALADGAAEHGGGDAQAQANAEAADGATNADEATVPQPHSIIGEVTVHSIEEPRLPEVDDEFMEWYGIKAGEDRPARFRTAVRERMELELADAKHRTIRREVIQALSQAHDFDVPEALLNAQYRTDLKRIGDAVSEQMKASCLLAAKRRIYGQLVMREIVAQESLQVDDQRVRQRIEDIAGCYEESAEVRRFIYADEQQLQNVEQAVLEEQVLSLILSQAQQVTVPMSYQEMISGQAMTQGLPPPLLEDAPDDSGAERAEQANAESLTADATAKVESDAPTEQEAAADAVVGAGADAVVGAGADAAADAGADAAADAGADAAADAVPVGQSKDTASKGGFLRRLFKKP